MPSIIAKKHITHKFGAKEYPSKAIDVRSVLYAETLLVPSLAITLELIMLDMTVPQDTMTVTRLPNEKGSPKSEYMAGQAVPKSESGIPKPIKAIYIIINNAVAIECPPRILQNII